MKQLTVCGTVLVLLFGGLVASASAQPAGEGWIESFFDVVLTWDNDFLVGGGSGWAPDGNPTGEEGEWVYYENTEWWNEWFYDHPLDPNRWKEIEYAIDVETQDGFPSNVDIVVNWSSLTYPESGPAGPPPIPPLTLQEEEDFIVRTHEVYSGEVGSLQHFEDTIIIPDFNPEWVSIDVRVNEGSNDNVIVSGVIWHRCVPEPSAILLLATAAVGLLLFAQRRR
jgi:hypothetical protein